LLPPLLRLRLRLRLLLSRTGTAAAAAAAAAATAAAAGGGRRDVEIPATVVKTGGGQGWMKWPFPNYNGAKNGSFEPFTYKRDHFAKTGSGQI
jgi:hypothetical protein